MNTIDELDDIAFLEGEVKRLRTVLLLLVNATEAFVRTPSTSKNLLNTALAEAWDILEDEDD